MGRSKLTLVLALAALLGVAATAYGQKPAGKAKPAAGERPRYDLLYRVHVPTFADAIVAKIKEGVQKDLARPKSSESEEDFAIRKQLAETLRDAWTRAVKDLEDFSIGWRLDRKQKLSYLDLTLTAKPNTTTARQVAQLPSLKTAFSAFAMPGAAISARWVGQHHAADAAAGAKLVQLVRAKALKQIDQQSLSADDKKVRRELADKLFDVLQQSAASGRDDGALSVVVQPQAVTLLFGAYVADGAKLESVFKPVAEFLQQHHPLFGSLRLNADTCQGVNLHTLALPAPPGQDRENFARLFGESLQVVIGFGKEAIYLAAGRDALKRLKEAIQKSSESVVPPNPFEVSLSLKPVADFVAAVGRPRDQKQAQRVAQVLAKAPGKDHARLVARPVERGVILRFEVEQGILDLIGTAVPQVRHFIEGK